MIKIQNHQLRYLWQVSAGQRLRILLSCGIGAVGVGLSLCFIYSSKTVIDIASGSQDGDIWSAGIYTALFLLAQIGCRLADTWVSTKMQLEAGNDLRRQLFSRLLLSRWNELEHFHSGDVINRIEQDASAIVTLLTSSIPSLLILSIQFTAAFAFFCTLDTSLPWLLLALLPIFLIGSRFYMRKMKRLTKSVRESNSQVQSIIQESLQHRIVIKTLEQNEQHIGKLDRAQNVLLNQVVDRTRFSMLSQLMVSLAFSGGYLIAFLWGTIRLSSGSITFGSMTAFLQLVGQLQQPALGLSRLLPSFINALAAIDRLQELEQLPAEPEKKRILFPQAPDIILSDIAFAYGKDEKPIFEKFCAFFPAGSRTAVLGETGAGKTTLIRLLLALAEPQSGTMDFCIDGKKFAIDSSTRSNFVYVPQGNTLFSGTIRDNLLMGNPDATETEMKQALQTAVANYVFELPKGMDTVLNELGGGLSEGQAQRIAIARALLRPGTILLLDESTSALDISTEQLLLENLYRNYAEKTFIFITHHSALANACERKLQL